jgi:1-acyl-sn-glycerol-3-phosphate acyltransferase
MREQVYVDPRPAEHFARFHERTRSREPDAMYEIVKALTGIYAWTAFRARCISSEKVPFSGPVIIAPNHFSFMDHFFVAIHIRRRVHFMAKSQMFKPPLQFIYTHGGVFPVRRGKADDEAFKTAHAVLARGGTIVMYPEGGRSRHGGLADHAKAGIGRLALESGATVVPVAIHGSSRVRNWKWLQFPKVTVQYGDPIRYEQVDEPTREQQQAVADEVFGRIKVLYGGLETLGRKRTVRAVRAARRAERRGRTAPAG